MVIIMLVCFPCWAIFFNSRHLLILLGQDHDVARLSHEYLTYYCIGLPGFVITVGLTKYLQAQSIVFPSVCLGLVCALLNALFHWVFVYYLDMEVRGGGLAVALTYCCLAISHILYIRISGCYRNTWPGFCLRESLLDWGKFSRLSLLAMLMMCLEWWSFEILTFVVGMLGLTQLGAHTIIQHTVTMLFMISSGQSNAASVRVGNSLGEGQFLRAANSSRVSMAFIWTWAILIGTAILGLRNYIPGIFTQDRSVIDLASGLLPLLALEYITDASQTVLSGIIRGMGRQSFGTTVNLLAYYFVGLPTGICLALLTSLQVAGAWWGMVASTGLQTVMYLIRLAVTDWGYEAKLAQARVADAAVESETKALFEDNQNGTETTRLHGIGYHAIESSQKSLHSDRRLSSSDQPPVTSNRSWHSENSTTSSICELQTKDETPIARLECVLILKRLAVLVVMVSLFIAGVICNDVLDRTLELQTLTNGSVVVNTSTVTTATTLV